MGPRALYYIKKEIILSGKNMEIIKKEMRLEQTLKEVKHLLD